MKNAQCLLNLLFTANFFIKLRNSCSCIYYQDQPLQGLFIIQQKPEQIPARAQLKSESLAITTAYGF